MEKSVVMKIFLVILVSVMLIVCNGYVQAVDNTTGYQDLTQATKNNTSNNTSNSTNTNTSTNTTNTTNTNNSAKNNSLNTGAVTGNKNNTSTYNNSSLPKTGVEDSIPTMLLLVVFGISAVYAYKKIRDYKNV